MIYYETKDFRPIERLCCIALESARMGAPVRVVVADERGRVNPTSALSSAMVFLATAHRDVAVGEPLELRPL